MWVYISNWSSEYSQHSNKTKHNTSDRVDIVWDILHVSLLWSTHRGLHLWICICIHVKLWDVITHPYGGLIKPHLDFFTYPCLKLGKTMLVKKKFRVIHNVNGGLTKPSVKLGHGWVIPSHVDCGCNYLSVPEIPVKHISKDTLGVITYPCSNPNKSCK